MSKIIAILQARMSSRRLPGKVLQPVLGEPMILRQLERIQRSRRLNQTIVATSNDASDDPLVEVLSQQGILFSRGSLTDVLERFYQTAETYHPDHVVRLTGDCPLVDPELIDAIVSHHLNAGADYTSNTITPTYPDGLDIEVMTYAALVRAQTEATLPAQREHVTPYIHQNPGFFTLVNYCHPSRDLSNLRWTVDEPEDLQFVQTVFERLYIGNPAFSTVDVLELLSREPELAHLNAGHTRNAAFKL